MTEDDFDMPEPPDDEPDLSDPEAVHAWLDQLRRALLDDPRVQATHIVLGAEFRMSPVGEQIAELDAMIERENDYLSQILTMIESEQSADRRLALGQVRDAVLESIDSFRQRLIEVKRDGPDTL